MYAPLQVHNATLECPERADEIDANRRRAHIDILAARFGFPAKFVRIFTEREKIVICKIFFIFFGMVHYRRLCIRHFLFILFPLKHFDMYKQLQLQNLE